MDPSLHIYTYSEVLKKLRSFLKKAKKPLIIIGGPTASGKTKLAVTLCKLFKGEVISADSRQIYSEMEIGNERTKPEEMEGIPHHCIAITDPSDTITAAEFKRIAEKTIDKIRKKGCIPFLVGGTGLYINTIVKNFQIPVMNTDSSLRKKLSLLPMDRLLKMLKTVDPGRIREAKSAKKQTVHHPRTRNSRNHGKTEIKNRHHRKTEVRVIPDSHRVAARNTLRENKRKNRSSGGNRNGGRGNGSHQKILTRSSRHVLHRL